MTVKPLVAGNWKMNGLRASLAELDAMLAGLSSASAGALICPPASLVAACAERVRGTALGIGGQDCHAAPSGAHTGDVSAEMLADAGASHVILGHSERRADHGERDGDVRAKAEAALRAGLTPIVCIGETEGERDAGRTLEVVLGQLSGSLPGEVPSGRLVVAYEPVWAIGTGRTPSEADIGEVHAALRAAVVERLGPDAGGAVPLLYGGSVKPGNAAAIFAIEEVDGGLVGGASLKAADFLAILRAAG